MSQVKCPHCQNKDETLIGLSATLRGAAIYYRYYCEVCSKVFEVKEDGPSRSGEDSSEGIKEEIQGTERDGSNPCRVRNN